MTQATAFEALKADFALFDDWEDKYRALIDLGKTLEPMPSALKTEATKVRGCSSQVWLHATQKAGALHFMGDSDAHIVKGLVGLVLLLVQDQPASTIAAMDMRAALGDLGLGQHLSPTRTNGLFSMVARIQEMARQQAAA
jgi:cysteine desulfuration protein SufE